MKLSLSGLAKMSDLKMDRILPIFSVDEDANKVAKIVRETLYPKVPKDSKKFLEAVIDKFAASNILVFEFVESPNLKQKVNIDGFYLQPNVIVLRRNQDYFKREIFTLAHELGHYLLNQEEVESMDYDHFALGTTSKVESWCNSFAFAFLAGEKLDVLDQLPEIGKTNDYSFEEIKVISQATHLSFTAMLTYLVRKGKMSGAIYGRMRKELEDTIQAKKKIRKKKKRELEKEMGKSSMGAQAKPIQSPLFVSAIQTAFFLME
ncbi:ImmA/IrrE family metallo-endopeptidase [Algoriphagus boritolerans]|uniref:ImmA/IrrE family metallo-endopeptidase n=1 Tax=Algoriphagus boritolerans TaxID=308111 RepID=UPI000AA01A2E